MLFDHLVLGVGRRHAIVVEATRSLYPQHSVEAIAGCDARAENLRVTRIFENIIDDAKRAKLKVICFVVGVWCAGKTLVELNIATRRMDADVTSLAVDLSGNARSVTAQRSPRRIHRRASPPSRLTKTADTTTTEGMI